MAKSWERGLKSELFANDDYHDYRAVVQNKR